MKVDQLGVHATHCCKRCGCKYGDPFCPVVSETVVAEFPCEDCEERLNSLVYELNNATNDELSKVFSELTLLTQLTIRGLLRTLL